MSNFEQDYLTYLSGYVQASPLSTPPELPLATATTPHPTRQQGGKGQPERCRITLLTVVFNSEATLSETLSSVAEGMAHTERMRPGETDLVEHIVIDGGSTDASLDVLRTHDHQLNLWVSEPDGGMYDAVNKGISLAKGDLVHLVNSDDLLPKDACRHVLDAADALGWPEDVVYKGDLSIIDEHGTHLFRARNLQSRWVPDIALLHPSWFVPRKLYERLGGYSVDFKISSDTEYFFRLLDAGARFEHIDEELGAFRTGGMSSSFEGLPECLRIHGAYLGRRHATALMLRKLWLKGRREAVVQLVGQDRANQIAMTLKRWTRRD